MYKIVCLNRPWKSFSMLHCHVSSNYCYWFTCTSCTHVLTQFFTGPPTITTHPTSQLTNVSMSVTLDCEGTGKSLTYQWQTRSINGKEWMNISNSNSERLVVRNLLQSKQYRCVVSNEAGSDISNVATVTILSKYMLVNLVVLK